VHFSFESFPNGKYISEYATSIELARKEIENGNADAITPAQNKQTP
jgi:hypothetical protein